jgi:hypothetical protein
MHTFFTDEESDDFFKNLKNQKLFKEKRILHKKFEEGEIMDDVYIDYIIRKERN